MDSEGFEETLHDVLKFIRRSFNGNKNFKIDSNLVIEALSDSLPLGAILSLGFAHGSVKVNLEAL